MRIAIISSGFLPVVDGVTVSLAQRLEVLSQLEHEVLVLCPDYGPIASIYPQWREHHGEILPGVTVVPLPSEPFMGVEFERNMSLGARAPLRQALEQFAPEIIHVDEPDRLFLGLLQAPGVAYAQARGIPCVGFYHTNFVDYIEDFFPLHRWLLSLIQWGSSQIIRRVFHRYDATLVTSLMAEQRIRQLGIRNGVCDRFLGINLAAFNPAARTNDFFQAHYGLSSAQQQVLNNRTKLVFLGRLTPDKGWHFTLNAFEAWSRQADSGQVTPSSLDWLQNIALIISGDGEMRAEIKTRLQALGLPVHVLGRIAPEAVPALLTNGDLHVTTSEKETLGLTILEAFAAGIPAIAPQAGGPLALIRPGENGLLFQPGDTHHFQKLLSSLVLDPSLRKRLGQQGQQDAIAYDADATTTRLLQLWQGQIIQATAQGQ